MKFIALSLSIFLVILGAYASRRYQLSTINKVNEQVLSVSEETSQTNTPTPTSLSNEEPTQSISPTQVPSNEFLVSSFIYPGAKVVTQTQTTLSLESSDDTDIITNWYKDKIKGMGANVKSFVVTRANDKVLNKLVGANSDVEVAVEISKDPGSSVAKISVLLTLP